MDGGEPAAVPLDLVDAGRPEIQPVDGAERDAESPAQHDLDRGHVTDHQDRLAAVIPQQPVTGPIDRATLPDGHELPLEEPYWTGTLMAWVLVQRAAWPVSCQAMSMLPARRAVGGAGGGPSQDDALPRGKRR